MWSTDPVTTFSFFFPALKKREGESQDFSKKKRKKKTFQQQVEGKKILTLRGHRQVVLSSSFVQNKHPHIPCFFPLPHSSKCPLCSFSHFPPFSAFRTAAVNMRSTPDTHQPPLIITAATKQENKYGREERRDEGWIRGSLCRVSGAIKRLDAAWNNKNRVLAEVGWGQPVLASRTETIWNTQICVWLVPDGTDWAKQ